MEGAWTCQREWVLEGPLKLHAQGVCREDGHKSDTIVFLEKKNRRERATQISGFSVESLVELDGIEPTTS